MIEHSFQKCSIYFLNETSAEVRKRRGHIFFE
jgi:hypothetical protein